MTRHRAARPGVSLRPGRVWWALAVALLVAPSVMGTYAYWSDSAQVAGGQFTSGTMDLQFDANGAVGAGTSYAATSINWDGLAPGEREAHNLVVRNVGDPTMTVTASVTRDPNNWTFVGSPLTVQVFSGAAVTTDVTYPIQQSCSGSQLGAIQSVGGTSKSLFSAVVEISGDSSAPLCVLVGLDTNASNDNQGATGKVLMNFVAEQKLS